MKVRSLLGIGKQRAIIFCDDDGRSYFVKESNRSNRQEGYHRVVFVNPNYRIGDRATHFNLRGTLRQTNLQWDYLLYNFY
jgi:hypothetical protein